MRLHGMNETLELMARNIREQRSRQLRDELVDLTCAPRLCVPMAAQTTRDGAGVSQGTNSTTSAVACYLPRLSGQAFSI